MRIFVVGGESRDLAAIENALRLGEVEILSAAAPIQPAPDQRRYAFAGWTPRRRDARPRQPSRAQG
jgi:hypothetical protein